MTMQRIEVELRPDEVDMFTNPKRCRKCDHLEALHSPDRDYIDLDGGCDECEYDGTCWHPGECHICSCEGE